MIRYAGAVLGVALIGTIVVADILGVSSSPDAFTVTAPTPTPSCGGIVVSRPLTPQEAVRALLEGATDLGTPGADQVYGAGRLDICASLAIAATITAPPPPSVGGVSEPGLR